MHQRFISHRFSALVLAGSILAFVACGATERFDGASVSGAPNGKPGVSSKCISGEVRACSVTLGERNGVLSCYHGSQVCVDEKWQACGDGEVKEQAAPVWPSSPGLNQQSLSMPEECTDNPCDPTCQVFSEDPEQPLEPEDGGSIYDWETGTLSDFPKGLVSKGLTEPCETGADCQFNMRCVRPATDSCDHSVCDTGNALSDGCNSCVDLVCAERAECCGNSANDDDVSACSHSPCTTGRGLDKSCNGCVATICESMPQCCKTNGNNTNWTAECVAAVTDICGNTCECAESETGWGDSCYYYESNNYDFDEALEQCEDYKSGWSLVTINSAAENTMISDWNNSREKYIGFSESSNRWRWESDPNLGYYNESSGSSSPSGFYTNWDWSHPGSGDPDCAYMNDDSSRWRGETSCGSVKRDSICEGPTSVMVSGGTSENGWDSTCVALAGSLCDVSCEGTGSSGSCKPWYPGETDPACAGVDLAVGVPCDGVIAVCNHGNATALAPIDLMHFPANSQQFPTCSPKTSHPQTARCTVREDIPPGECVNVPAADCDKGLSGNREIMVNPLGAMINTPDGPVAECSCLDNWSLYANKASECGEPICAGGSTSTTQVTKPVDIIIIVDNSPSMEDEIEEVQERIHTDLAQILADSNLDYRVIMVSRFGDVNTAEGTSAVNICIGAPLGANACTDPADEKLVLNPPYFYHFSAEIESTDSWCQLLYGFNHADEVGVTDDSWSGFGTARPWTTLAPHGWGSWLREDAFKHFMIISDDDIDCSDYGYNFDDSPGCEAFPHHCHNLSTQTVPSASVTAGEAAAKSFDKELLALSPEQFGTASSRNYMWHSIINITRHPDGNLVPWQASEAMQTAMCTPSGTTIVGAGTGYQALSRLTGGLRYPICENGNFDAIFNAVANEVIETAAASCEFLVADGNEFDPDSATVAYTDSDNEVTVLNRVSSSAACGSSTESWYYDDPANPTTLTLCPATCSVVQEDSGAQIWVELGCPGGPEETTIAEIYQASCPSGQSTEWAYMFYDTSIDAGSTGAVSFRVRSAASEAELEDAEWQDAATATAAAPDCSKGNPVPEQCPVDLFATLGAGSATLDFLELAITITPGSGTSPSVENWELTYSCPASE